MQAQKTDQYVPVRIIALAFALLAALLLASAAGYVVRGRATSTNPQVAQPSHSLQQTDNQMERNHPSAILTPPHTTMEGNPGKQADDRLAAKVEPASPILTSPFGVGH